MADGSELHGQIRAFPGVVHLPSIEKIILTPGFEPQVPNGMAQGAVVPCRQITQRLQQGAMTPVNSYRMVVLLYASLGLLLAFLFTRVSSTAEASTRGPKADLSLNAGCCTS